MKPIRANLTKLDEIISKQYEDKIRGIVKDGLQNSWEARIHRKRGTGFKMVFSYSKKIGSLKNVLVLEDFGTTGMDEKRWDAFHAHWQTTKGDYRGGVGRWGQGKTLFLYFSSKNRIITESVDKSGTYRYSVRTNIGFLELGDKPAVEDPAWLKKSNGDLKLINDFFPSKPKLNHTGTRIWIIDVKEDLAEEIVDGYLTRQISESWWELIRNYHIIIKVKVDSKITEVTIPQFPPTRDMVKMERLSIGANYGKINKLEIVLTKEPIPESLRGIAIQRGKMTVCRHQISSSFPEEIRERVYGCCTMSDSLDEEMWNIEMANHENFESRRGVWVTLRKKIDYVIEEFLSKYLKNKKTQLPSMNFEEIMKTVNKLVEEHLTGLGGGTRNPSTASTGNLSPAICISPWGYLGSDKRFDKTNHMTIKGAIKNKTKNNATINLKTRIDGLLQTYWNYDINNLQLTPNSNKILVFPKIEFSNLKIPKGKYFLKAEIRDANKRLLLHRRVAIFYFECDPPSLPPTSRGWLKKLLFSELGGPKAFLRNLPINDKGELLINTAHSEVNNVWKSVKLSNNQKAKKLEPIIVNISLHEAIRETSLKWWIDENIEYDIGEIKRAKDIFDEMWGAYCLERVI